MLIEVLIDFSDLDDTLYPLSSGIASHCSKNIQGTLFMNYRLIDFHQLFILVIY